MLITLPESSTRCGRLAGRCTDLPVGANHLNRIGDDFCCHEFTLSTIEAGRRGQAARGRRPSSISTLNSRRNFIPQPNHFADQILKIFPPAAVVHIGNAYGKTPVDGR